jgi:hypothetical protein
MVRRSWSSTSASHHGGRAASASAASIITWETIVYASVQLLASSGVHWSSKCSRVASRLAPTAG